MLPFDLLRQLPARLLRARRLRRELRLELLLRPLHPRVRPDGVLRRRDLRHRLLRRRVVLRSDRVTVPPPEFPAELRTRLLAWTRRRVADEATAEDLVQDVLLRFSRRPPETIDDVTAFVWRSMRNALIDHVRRSGTRRFEPISEQALAANTDAEHRDRECVLSCLRLFVDRLPEPQREALLLTDLGGQSQVAAARAVGISVSGMKSRVQRGRAAVLRALRICCQVESTGPGGAPRLVYEPESCRCP